MLALPDAKRRRPHRATSGLYGAAQSRTPAQHKAMSLVLATGRREAYQKARATRAEMQIAVMKNTIREATNRAVQEVSFLPHTITALALMARCARSTARYHCAAIAWIWLQRQNAILDYAAVKFDSIQYYWERVEADETKHVLQLQSHAVLLPHMAVSAWPVLVICMVLGWTWHGVDWWMPIIRCPVIVVGSCNANALWDALFDADIWAKASASIQVLRQRSCRNLLVREPDAAGYGIRTLAFEGQQQPANTLHSVSPCGLHAGSLLVRNVMKQEPEALVVVRGTHQYALQVRTGNYMARLALSMELAVEGLLSVAYTEPPHYVDDVAATQRRLLLQVFFPAVRAQGQRRHRAKGGRKKKASRKEQEHAKLKTDFDMFVNCDLCSSQFNHHCSPDRCNCRGDRQYTVKRTATILTQVFFYRRTKVPELDEWIALA